MAALAPQAQEFIDWFENEMGDGPFEEGREVAERLVQLLDYPDALQQVLVARGPDGRLLVHIHSVVKVCDSPRLLRVLLKLRRPGGDYLLSDDRYDYLRTAFRDHSNTQAIVREFITAVDEDGRHRFPVRGWHLMLAMRLPYPANTVRVLMSSRDLRLRVDRRFLQIAVQRNLLDELLRVRHHDGSFWAQLNADNFVASGRSQLWYTRCDSIQEFLDLFAITGVDGHIRSLVTAACAKLGPDMVTMLQNPDNEAQSLILLQELIERVSAPSAREREMQRLHDKMRAKMHALPWQLRQGLSAPLRTCEAFRAVDISAAKLHAMPPRVQEQVRLLASLERGEAVAGRPIPQRGNRTLRAMRRSMHTKWDSEARAVGAAGEGKGFDGDEPGDDGAGAGAGAGSAGRPRGDANAYAGGFAMKNGVMFRSVAGAHGHTWVHA